MDLKWILLVAFVLAVMVNQQVQAVSDFRPWPTTEELEAKGLKCAPGRTIIKLEEKKVETKVFDSGEEDDDFSRNGLRSHMNTNRHEEYCKVCVCSAAGKDEYCSGRPAANVNECIRMSKIMEQFTKNEPYDHTRLLSQRIRRDYIWHDDEIPYEAKAKCRRGHSYYSNSLTANDTDIDVASDVESLLDYTNRTICFYCVCSPSGRGVGCIPRQPWTCQYFRDLRNDDHPREVYKKLFQQDRPAYFRQLSWRLRRTMDDGLYDFTTAVGGGVTNKGESCVPFVSEYTDCNEDNQCSGCIKCVCALGGKWSCEKVHKCRGEDLEEISMKVIDSAMNEIQNSMENYKKNEAATSKTPFVPRPPTNDQDLLIGNVGYDMNLDAHIASLLRSKRAVGGANSTKGIKFYHTVDEINEDTLKHGNLSGTLQAHKVNVVKTPKISRRTGLFNPNGNDSQSSLHIAYSEPKVYDPHIADNKIEARNDEHYNKLSLKKVQAVVGNHTQKQKDKDLSKLVVNELKPGAEIIGDKKSKIMSNITFTPENDTLTAMAFIAGNLLNKLWNMEKESGEDSMETEVLKHEKIANLIDLFKEPLNLRQENFLKSALEHLSEAIDKNKIVKNVSLCQKLAESKNVLRAAQSSIEDTTTEKEVQMGTIESSKEEDFEVVTEAISKINNVLSLINKFQNVQNNLNDLKKKSIERNEKLNRKAFDEHEKIAKNNLTQDEAASLNVFGNVLDKITKLLLPPKKSKKMSKSIKNLNVLRNPKDVSKKIKSLYNIDVESSNLSPKDQLIADYLSAIKRNPKCILDNFRANDQNSIAKIEGDILLNLSEFFKVKSFMDLMKLVRPDTELSMRSQDDKTTKIPEVTTETTTSTIPTATEASNKLRATKDRLKAHLKTIIDDLVELQTATGNTSKNISIADALPCIYKMLNAAKSKQYKELDNRATTVPPVKKVAEIFKTLKEELVSTPNRRSGTYSGIRPKSATVWERVIKNVDDSNKLHTRRNLDVKEPKTFEELKTLMDESESGSKTYKNQALINGVPPSERLILLKTLSADVKQYIDVLEEIDNSMSSLEKITVEDKTDLKDFIDNAATNINLDDNIAKNINKLKVKYQNLLENRPKIAKKPREKYVQMQSMKRLDVNPPEERKNVKLSRDTIINQLIKNRMQLYVKLKESENDDLENDLNYSIAKSILTYLELGNSAIARELYKIIVSHKQKKVESTYLRAVKPTKPSSFGKLPVVQFEEPRGQNQLQWLNQDTWMKQLTNLKNMKA